MSTVPTLDRPIRELDSSRFRLKDAGWKDYLALTKPRIISLLLAITLVPMFLAGERPPAPLLIFWIMLGGYLAAGGANTLNQFVDRDIDTMMVRTAKRPLPSGRMMPLQVLLFGLGLSLLSFVQLWLTVNLLTALLALSGILLYIFLYTGLLKRRSTQNIVIGGAAGCVPPLVGWAAVANEISLLPVLMFLIVFYWTPPHFWALALKKKDEYAAAGVPMLPAVVGSAETRRQMVLYSVLLLIVSIVPVFMQLLGPIYLVGALLLNGIFLKQVLDLWRAPTEERRLRIYLYSLLFLALIFLAMGIDGLFYTAPADVANFHLRLP